MPSIAERILKYNYGRRNQLVAYKYKAMRISAFRFYRGTCHLFYEDFPQTSELNKTPHAWLSADLHIENFGTYKGDNRLVYFDINDFDEALLGPVAWDICRLLTSNYLACLPLKFSEADAARMNMLFLKQYTDSLKAGSAKTIEDASSQGIIKDFLKSLKHRNLKEVIKERTEKIDGRRHFVSDDEHIVHTPEVLKTKVKHIIKAWDTKRNREKSTEVIDAALRIMGTGSLGLERYVVLVKLKNQKDLSLIDIKKAITSSALAWCHVKQPKWESNAKRVIEIQSRMQFTTPALLEDVSYNDESFVIKELQLPQDKMNVLSLLERRDGYELLISGMANVTAWSQLRSGGRQGSAIIDELIEFGHKSRWQQEVMAYALHYYIQVKKDYKEYCEAFDDGVFGKYPEMQGK